MSDADDLTYTAVLTVAAPPSEVYAAWTEADRLGWYESGLPGATEPITADARVGGVWRVPMVVGDGADDVYPTGGVYLELEPAERVVFAWGAEGGWPALDPEHPEDAPTRCTVGLEPADGGEATTMTFVSRLPPALSHDELAACHAGWRMTLARLVAAYER